MDMTMTLQANDGHMMHQTRCAPVVYAYAINCSKAAILVLFLFRVALWFILQELHVLTSSRALRHSF